MTILFSLLALIAAVGLAVLYTKFVIIHYPEKRRKGSSIGTYVLFIILTILLLGANFSRIASTKSINFFADTLEQYVITNFYDNDFVRNGFDLNKAGDDIMQLNSVISDVAAMLPSADSLGVPQFLYSMIIDSARDKILEHISKVGSVVEAGAGFADENGFLTVSSLVNGLKNNVIRIINNIFIVIASILALILVIYIIVTLVRANNYKKKAA